MTIAVGVFELFTYAIPGSLYVALFTYIAARAQWIDLAAVLKSPSFLLVIVVVLLSLSLSSRLARAQDPAEAPQA